MSQQEAPGSPGTLGEVLCCASLNEVTIHEDAESKKVVKLGMQASHHCLLSPGFIPSNIMCPPMGLASLHESVLANVHMSPYQMMSPCS